MIVDVSDVLWMTKYWNICQLYLKVYVDDGRIELYDDNGLVVAGDVLDEMESDNGYVYWVITDEAKWVMDSGISWLAYPVDVNMRREIDIVIDTFDGMLSIEDYYMFNIGDEVVVYCGGVVVSGELTGKDSVSKRRVYVSGHGKELARIYVRKIFYNLDCYDIVSELVENFTDLSLSGEETGLVFDKFVVNDYLVNIVVDLAHALGYNVRIDDRVVKFYPVGGDLAQYILDGSVVRFKGWKVSMEDMVNEVYFRGGVETFNITETFTYTGDNVINLKYHPYGSLRVLINGELTECGIDYVVDMDSGVVKILKSLNSGDTIEVEYDYGVSVFVKVRNDDSISKYGIYDKKVVLDWIDSFDVARVYAKALIRLFSSPSINVVAEMPLPLFARSDIDVGKLVHCIDRLEKKDLWLTVKKIEIKNGIVKLELGSRVMTLADWLSDVKDKIRMLSEERLKDDKILNYVSFSEGISSVIGRKIYNVRYQKILGGMRIGIGNIGVDKLGVKYSGWQVVV